MADLAGVDRGAGVEAEQVERFVVQDETGLVAPDDDGRLRRFAPVEAVVGVGEPVMLVEHDLRLRHLGDAFFGIHGVTAPVVQARGQLDDHRPFHTVADDVVVGVPFVFDQAQRRLPPFEAVVRLEVTRLVHGRIVLPQPLHEAVVESLGPHLEDPILARHPRSTGEDAQALAQWTGLHQGVRVVLDRLVHSAEGAVEIVDDMSVKQELMLVAYVQRFRRDDVVGMAQGLDAAADRALTDGIAVGAQCGHGNPLR